MATCLAAAQEHIAHDLHQNLHCAMGVDDHDAISAPELAEVDDMVREKDTDTAAGTNLRARGNIRATRQGLPCAALLARLDATGLACFWEGSDLPIRLVVGSALFHWSIKESKELLPNYGLLHL